MTMPMNQPQSGNAMPRFAGLATMMRLPAAPSAAGLDAAFIGVPLDIGTSNRAGARFGPRQMRAESALLRPYNMATGAAPFDTLQVADLGDVPINTYSIAKSLEIITAFYEEVMAAGCKPLTLGGDHTIALPILRSLHRDHGKIAVLHFDAHLDTWDTYFGAPFTHGTPFRRASEEGLLDLERCQHMGIRGPLYAATDLEDDAALGFQIVRADDYEVDGVRGAVDRMRRRLGDGPVYVSIDIDVLDPAHAPGTGTPEAGGLTSRELLHTLRGVGYMISADA